MPSLLGNEKRDDEATTTPQTVARLYETRQHGAPLLRPRDGMPLTYLELTEAEIEAFGAQKQRRVRARRARAWKRMAREERDAAAGPPTPQAVTKRRPRYRRGKRRKAEEPHPYADPSRPLPNLAAADRFESYYWAQNLVATPQEWVKMIGTLHRANPNP